MNKYFVVEVKRVFGLFEVIKLNSSIGTATAVSVSTHQEQQQRHAFS